MKLLTKLLAVSAGAASIIALAGSANAVVFVNDWSIATDGQITVTFGDGGNGGDLGIGTANASGTAGDHGTEYTHTISTGPHGTVDFTDTFNFFLPTGTVLNAAVSTSTLDFDSINFNSVAGTVSNSPGFEVAHVSSVAVTGGEEQELTITGSGVTTAGWSGTATFTPTPGVPEPATWMLMIVGFGGAGALLRNRRRTAAVAA